MSFKIASNGAFYYNGTHLLLNNEYTGISAIYRKNTGWKVFYGQKILSNNFMSSIDLEHLEYFYYWAKKHINV